MRRVFIITALLALVASIGPHHSFGQAADPVPTWAQIQRDILNPNCTTCHSAGTSFARQSGLVLTEDVAFTQLVGAEPRNTAARNDRLTRVSARAGLPGIEKSFLWEKINAPQEDHFYSDHPHYGAIMPLGQPFLTNGQLRFIQAWIEAGAPEAGVVADPALLADDARFEPPPFVALDPPDSGFQFHLGPFDVWGEIDREVLYFEPVATQTPQFIAGYEITMRPGSHHFILYNYPGDQSTPEPGVYRDIRDARRSSDVSEAANLFPLRFFIGTQTPSVNYSFPPGIALRLPPGLGFDLNSHYVKTDDETIFGEVYANLYTMDPTEVEFVALPGHFSNFNINLPPQKVTTLTETFEFSEKKHIIQMWSHAHEKMLEFSVERVGGADDGQLLYWTNDWEHPPLLEFDTPLTVKQGEGFRLTTTYHNWTDRTIGYGLQNSDEMQFVFFIYYTDTTAGPAGLIDSELTVLDEGLAEGWQIETMAASHGGSTDRVPGFSGSQANSFRAEPASAGRTWQVRFDAENPVTPYGYEMLKFAFHSGQSRLQADDRFSLHLGGASIDLLGPDGPIDPNNKDWQVVEIPLHDRELSEIRRFGLRGSWAGTFYLDDVHFAGYKSTVSSSAIGGDEALPLSLRLDPNFPNPFNDGTEIPFSLAFPSQVELSLYNVTGQQVRTLVRGARAAGKHYAQWDGRDERGRDLSSGVYFYRLRTNAGGQTRKLLLLR
jgi:hypothetical protein